AIRSSTGGSPDAATGTSAPAPPATRDASSRAMILSGFRSAIVVATSFRIEGVLDLGRRDVAGPFQVHHLAVLLQEVELAFPVVPHHEHRRPVAANVVDLLFPRVLREHLVDVPDGFEHRLPVLVVQQRRLVLALVEFVRGQTHHQPVTQRPRPAQEVDVADVEDVKRSVGDDGLHWLSMLPTGGMPSPSTSLSCLPRSTTRAALRSSTWSKNRRRFQASAARSTSFGGSNRDSRALASSSNERHTGPGNTKSRS